MKNWQSLLVKATDSILDAVATIDRASATLGQSTQIALVATETGKLVGTVTDGDVRRAILRGMNLQEPVESVMRKQFKSATAETPREEVYREMVQLGLRHIPLVDAKGALIGVASIEDFLGASKIDNPVIIMAGGLGTRLRPLTNDTPKPMLMVGSKPILEIILDNLIRAGFHNFYISVNYKSEMIKEHFGTGERWHVDIKYLEEKESRGTAGALTLLPAAPTSPFMVVNGDVLTRLNYQALLDFHTERASVATMCIREHDFQIPYGVVEVDNFAVTSILEKPTKKYFVNGGMYVLSPECLSLIPASGKFDMPELLKSLLQQQKMVSSFPISDYWLDVGQHDDYQRARQEAEKILIVPGSDDSAPRV